MSLQMACLGECTATKVAFVWLFSVSFQMSPQIACLWGSKGTLVAFIWFNDFVTWFLKDFHICIIFKSLFHCHCVLCFAQMVALNWANCGQQSPSHFYFLIIVRQMFWKEGDTCVYTTNLDNTFQMISSKCLLFKWQSFKCVKIHGLNVQVHWEIQRSTGWELIQMNAPKTSSTRRKFAQNRKAYDMAITA